MGLKCCTLLEQKTGSAACLHHDLMNSGLDWAVVLRRSWTTSSPSTGSWMRWRRTRMWCRAWAAPACGAANTTPRRGSGKTAGAAHPVPHLPGGAPRQEPDGACVQTCLTVTLRWLCRSWVASCLVCMASTTVAATHQRCSLGVRCHVAGALCRWTRPWRPTWRTCSRRWRWGPRRRAPCGRRSSPPPTGGAARHARQQHVLATDLAELNQSWLPCHALARTP